MSSRQHRNPHQLFNKILHWSDTKHVKTSLQGHLNLSVWPRTGIWYSFTHTKPHWSVRCLTPEAQAWVTDGRRRARGHGTNTSVYFESHAAGSGACFRFTWRNQIKPFTHINQLRAWDITDHRTAGPDPALQLFKECFAKLLLCNF